MTALTPILATVVFILGIVWLMMRDEGPSKRALDRENAALRESNRDYLAQLMDARETLHLIASTPADDNDRLLARDAHERISKALIEGRRKARG